MTKVIETHSFEETEALAERLAKALQPGDIIAFYGDLGAGKTTFVRGLARGLKAEEQVSSPTFVLMHIYEGRLPLYHFDAYRLTSWEDFANIGAEEYLYGDGVCCLEWAEIVDSMLPSDYLRINLKTLDDHRRSLEFVSLGPRSQALVEVL